MQSYHVTYQSTQKLKGKTKLFKKLEKTKTDRVVGSSYTCPTLLLLELISPVIRWIRACLKLDRKQIAIYNPDKIIIYKCQHQIIILEE